MLVEQLSREIPTSHTYTRSNACSNFLKFWFIPRNVIAKNINRACVDGIPLLLVHGQGLASELDDLCVLSLRTTEASNLHPRGFCRGFSLQSLTVEVFYIKNLTLVLEAGYNRRSLTEASSFVTSHTPGHMALPSSSNHCTGTTSWPLLRIAGSSISNTVPSCHHTLHSRHAVLDHASICWHARLQK